MTQKKTAPRQKKNSPLGACDAFTKVADRLKEPNNYQRVFLRINNSSSHLYYDRHLPPHSHKDRILFRHPSVVDIPTLRSRLHHRLTLYRQSDYQSGTWSDRLLMPLEHPRALWAEETRRARLVPQEPEKEVLTTPYHLPRDANIKREKRFFSYAGNTNFLVF